MRIDNTLAAYSAKIAELDRQNPQSTAPLKGESFEKVLESRLNGQQSVAFSKHAQARMESRDLSLSSNELAQLDTAVQRAREKGVTDTLVLMQNKAFIVNTKNNVVVTAMDGDELKKGVFTNIDGAVIA